MSDKKTDTKTLSNPFLRRYSPFQRYSVGDGFASQDEYVLKPVDYGESITDKESYRLSLASGRGSSLGSPTTSTYMFPDGKYDPVRDFSFVSRKDLTVQEIDSYLEAMRVTRSDADKELAAEIDKQIKELEKTKLDTLKKDAQSVETSASE